MALDEILRVKWEEVRGRLSRQDVRLWRRQAEACPAPRAFLEALKGRQTLSVIAEVKRASPSRGPIRPDVDIVELVQVYCNGGASAVSVLTDEAFFLGSLNDIEEVRRSTHLPVLRKDFILHELQLYEARCAGADAVLLIACALEMGRLRDLYQQGLELGLTPLVEVHNERELDMVLELDPAVLGVNHRDLRTLDVSLDVSRRLLPSIPQGVLVVAESGIRGLEEARMVARWGADAILVGEALMLSERPLELVRQLVCVRRHERCG